MIDRAVEVGVVVISNAGKYSVSSIVNKILFRYDTFRSVKCVRKDLDTTLSKVWHFAEKIGKLTNTVKACLKVC